MEISNQSIEEIVTWMATNGFHVAKYESGEGPSISAFAEEQPIGASGVRVFKYAVRIYTQGNDWAVAFDGEGQLVETVLCPSPRDAAELATQLLHMKLVQK